MAKIKGYIFITNQGNYYMDCLGWTTINKKYAHIFSMQEAKGFLRHGWGLKSAGKWRVVYE